MGSDLCELLERRRADFVGGGCVFSGSPLVQCPLCCFRGKFETLCSFDHGMLSDLHAYNARVSLRSAVP
jgi:hypothetical protein